MIRTLFVVLVLAVCANAHLRRAVETPREAAGVLSAGPSLPVKYVQSSVEEEAEPEEDYVIPMYKAAAVEKPNPSVTTGFCKQMLQDVKDKKAPYFLEGKFTGESRKELVKQCGQRICTWGTEVAEASAPECGKDCPQPCKKAKDFVGNLLFILQTKAAQHARHELNRAWDELDNAYAVPELVGGAGGAKKPAKGSSTAGPGYSPFSRHEEHFFIRNQIVNAIQQESLVELRRALTYAMAFGIDPRTVDIETAYRDCLSKRQQADGFHPRHVKEVLENGDWWSALDLIIGAALTKGADRNMLLKMIGKVCMTSQFTISLPIKSTSV